MIMYFCIKSDAAKRCGLKARALKGEAFVLEVKFYREAEDRLLKFAVIYAMAGEKMVLVRHRERRTYEIPGATGSRGDHRRNSGKGTCKEETGADDIYSEAGIRLFCHRQKPGQ